MKVLTRAEYEAAVARPKRRFRSLSLAGGRVTLRNPVPGPSYWFERNEVGQEHPSGRYLRIPYMGTITLMVDGVPSAFFYLAGRRLDTCTIAYHLTPAQLRKTLTVMRRERLQHLIEPAAQWALKHMPGERRPVLEGALRGLLKRGARAAPSNKRMQLTRSAKANGRRGPRS